MRRLARNTYRLSKSIDALDRFITPHAPVQRVQKVIDEDDLFTDALGKRKYDESKHPRDAKGRWTVAGAAGVAGAVLGGAALAGGGFLLARNPALLRQGWRNMTGVAGKPRLSTAMRVSEKANLKRTYTTFRANNAAIATARARVQNAEFAVAQSATRIKPTPSGQGFAESRFSRQLEQDKRTLEAAKLRLNTLLERDKVLRNDIDRLESLLRTRRVRRPSR